MPRNDCQRAGGRPGGPNQRGEKAMQRFVPIGLMIFSVAAVAVEASDAVTRRSLTTATTVSDGFRRQVRQASLTIPDRLWLHVEQSGWEVRMAEFVVDAAPSLRNRRPRGWPQSATWNHSDAVHLPEAKLLVLAEKRLTSNGQIVPSNRIPGVLRHEFGHAFDIAAGGTRGAYSTSSEFIACYRRDVNALRVEDEPLLGYYLQDERAGCQEAFAEAFAITFGGGSDVTRKQEFSRAFPRVLQHVKRLLQPSDVAAR